jgi:hypothetical protein
MFLGEFLEVGESVVVIFVYLISDGPLCEGGRGE